MPKLSEAEREKLFAELTVEAHRIYVFPLLLDLGSAVALIGNRQLGLRHPGNKGPSSVIARDIIDRVAARLREDGYPAHAELIMRGFDLDEDL